MLVYTLIMFIKATMT